MEVILSTIIGFGVILVLSCILGKLSFGIFYLIYIVPIRMSVGGYHAKSYFKCNIIFAIFFVLAFLLCENQTVQGFKVLAYINLVSVFFIMRYAPLENENKKLSDSKKNIYKHVNILIYTIGGMAGVYFKNIYGINVLTIVLNVVTVLLILGKGVEGYEKNKNG